MEIDAQQILNRILLNDFSTKVSIALSRGALTSALRQIDETNPDTWEFSAFSQNGEDGIIDFLLSKVKNPNRYFIEIGASDGTENNSSFLAIGKKYSGLMIEGNPSKSLICQHITLSPFVDVISMFISLANCDQLEKLAQTKNPDYFSLDIDGVDYYVAQRLLELGFRPKIVTVEYNSTFGPDQNLTVKYDDNFDFASHESRLYYGVSITAWKILFEFYGYKFITVEQNGVNAFFVNPSDFDSEFLNNINGTHFRENAYQLRKFKCNWEKQLELIQDMEFKTVLPPTI